MPAVSLTMIVRDEAENLPRCLASCAGLFDEMVIVDTGSTDDTKAIAASFGARVFDFAWCDDFSAARNESLRHATGDWMFWLDADEAIEGSNREKLSRLLAQPTSGVAYQMRTVFDRWTPRLLRVRLFPRGNEWRGSIHENLVVKARSFTVVDIDIHNCRPTSLERLAQYEFIMRGEIAAGRGNPSLYETMAGYLLDRNDLDGAAQMFDLLLKDRPRLSDWSEWPLTDLGMCYGRLGWWDRLAVVEGVLSTSEGAEPVLSLFAQMFPAEIRIAGVAPTCCYLLGEAIVGGTIVV